jgi:hypothetical protein
MNTYLRNGKITSQQQNEPIAPPAAADEKEKGVRVNGYQQVLEMLSVADAEFRESLLKRMAVHDKQLVISLRAELAQNYQIF